MFATALSLPDSCPSIDDDVTDAPISASVGAGGSNRPGDVRAIQQMLNSVPVASGGPPLLLAEDGVCGPKTLAAIRGYQAKVRPSVDGRIDAAGPTIKALTSFLVDAGAVPAGPLGLASRPAAAGGSPNKPAVTSPLADDIVAYGIFTLRVMEPRLNLLRFRMARMNGALRALLNKHFKAGGKEVTDADIQHIQKILARVHFHVARANAFGAVSADSVIIFDPKPATTLIGWTVRGGDKLSTKQFQLYLDDDNIHMFKAPGFSVFLTDIFPYQPGYTKHWMVLHEMCHFVGPRDGSGAEINDYAYAFSPAFDTLTKRDRLHNAESLSLFFLEFCVGTDSIVNLPRLHLYASKYGAFPKVVGGEIVTA